VRELSEAERALVAAAREKAFILYEGVRVPHHSCGTALAVTFGLPSRAYEALRRGGVTGRGECGAIKAGELVIGEHLGDPDPTSPARPSLKEALAWYQVEIRRRLFGQEDPDVIYTCNSLTRPRGDFAGAERKAFCTGVAAEVAACAAEAILGAGGEVRVEKLP
jgi:hypothetical protein